MPTIKTKIMELFNMPTFKYNGEILYCPKCGSKKLIAEENPFDVEMGK